MSIAIFKAGPSNGAVALKNSLGATLLRSEGSAYRPTAQKLLINWGSSNAEAQRLTAMTPARNTLNQPRSIARASNKKICLEVLTEQGLSTVPWYTNLEAALGHADNGRIYARTKLTGSSGEGIRMIMSTQDAQADEAREEGFPFPVDFVGTANMAEQYRGTNLFTIGITGKRQEWRIHVVQGEVILSQLKLRRQGFEEDEGYTSLVRNVETGWVYSVNFDQAAYPQLEAVKALAIRAVAALGLDFGAVDLVERRGEPYVLEVNTAPGLEEEGSSLRAYTAAFQRIEQGLRQAREA